MKKVIFVLTGLVVASVATAQNVPSGVTGLWRFQTDANKLTATIGTDLTTSDPGNSAWAVGPWTVINPGLSDNGIVQERSWDYLTVTHGIAPNGGGSYVNQYTVAIDYVQTQAGAYNSLFQTGSPHGNDGDLFIVGGGDGTDRTTSTIGIGAAGYSTLTFDSSQWHRIVWSIDNSSFFRVYVDGALFVDGAGQGVDGRFSLDPTFELFADNDWEDMWGYVGMSATWDRALTSAEVAGMGGWVAGAAEATPLTIPEPTTLSLAALGGLLYLLKRNRK
jgi:hypothetical protein